MACAHEINRGKIPPLAKQPLVKLADQAIRDCDNLRKLTAGNADMVQLRKASAAMDRATDALESQFARFAAYAPAANAAMTRANFAEQQLNAALYGGTDAGIDRVRRRPAFLEQQAEALRDVCGNVNDGTPAARELERSAAPSVSGPAPSIAPQTLPHRFANSRTTSPVCSATGGSSVRLQLSIKPPVNLRLQATRVEGTMPSWRI